MASTILRSRLSYSLSRNYNPIPCLFSSNANQATEGTAAASGPQIEAAATAPQAEAAASAAAAGPERKGWSFVKYGIIAALTGATGFAGYASYAYTLEEVEEKTKALRESVNCKIPEDASSVEKYKGLIYSAAMTVPAKAAEFYLDLRKLTEEQVKGYTEPTSDKLLPDLHPSEQHVFTLVLDLNETIIYSDWKRDRGWRTFKRPGVDDFLQHLAKLYEVVVYSDQLNMYVDPVVERLDPNHCIRYRLSRGATKYQDGKHFRDLSKLNRDPRKVIYVSANALENCLQPENAVPIKPFKIDDKGNKGEESVDTTLLDLIPFLEYVARASPSDIRQVLSSYERKDIAQEFKERSKETQRRMEEQRQHQGFIWRR